MLASLEKSAAAVSFAAGVMVGSQLVAACACEKGAAAGIHATVQAPASASVQAARRSREPCRPRSEGVNCCRRVLMKPLLSATVPCEESPGVYRAVETRQRISDARSRKPWPFSHSVHQSLEGTRRDWTVRAYRVEGGTASHLHFDRASTRVAAPFGPIWSQFLAVCVSPSVYTYYIRPGHEGKGSRTVPALLPHRASRLMCSQVRQLPEREGFGAAARGQKTGRLTSRCGIPAQRPRRRMAHGGGATTARKLGQPGRGSGFLLNRRKQARYGTR